MRIAFMGTPAFSVTALEALLASGHEIAAVYTQPPAPRGRGQALQPSPVHAFAESHGLTVRTPPSLRDPEAIAAFQTLDLDAAVVVAYGQILVRAVLDAPRLGCFNLHASLLPRWRGAAPIQRAIMAGDTATGVQVMRMSEGLDEGPVLATAKVPILAEDTAATLHDKLALAGAALLAPTLAALEAGTAVETPQAEEGATYAKKIKAKEARIDWRRPAVELDRHIRGLSPFPGAWFELATAKGLVRVKALMSRLAPDGEGAPGEVLDGLPDGVLSVACGEGAVRLQRLQREGRAPQSAAEFLRGQPLAPGVRLG
jgi:methionyl-tRNA formyltransferase